ncbi:hypothetical protein C7D73_30345, partial [Klebsiella pneumoniae]
GKTLQQIADEWQVSLHDAAARLMPAGAIYHNMVTDEFDIVITWSEAQPEQAGKNAAADRR